MKHYTKYEDTNITIEMSSYETPTHDKYNPKYDKSIRPFRVAYINLSTHGYGENRKKIYTDKIMVFVNIAMIDNIIPELVFNIVDVKPDSYLSKSYIDEILRFISEGIKYNDIKWFNNMDFSNINSGIPINPLTANHSPG